LCGGFTKEDTENLLIDLDFFGIDNVVALRGDAVKSETYFKAEKEGNQFASELVTQISNLNNGIYLDEDLQNSTKTNFCIGVSGYPEKHMEAPSLDSDIHFLKEKIRNGAEYIITQMFFDNKKFFDFVDKCRKAGITVPIIPGLKPIATKKQLNLIPHRFSIELPDDLTVKIEENNTLSIWGADKQKVGQFAANIRSLKKVEPYKGKGFRYQGEKVRRKVGKKAGATK
jgi:methylenetetrahydrofolate reductase (NADPH)